MSETHRYYHLAGKAGLDFPDAKNLKRWADALHRQCVAMCNIPDHPEAKAEKLEAKIKVLALEYSACLEINRDPRGAPVRLTLNGYTLTP